VADGEAALDRARNGRPDLILLDLMLPGMSGIEATQEIRRMEEGLGRHVPIIGVTAHALKGDRERCLEAGMDDYLSKPISPKALLDKIDRWSVDGPGERLVRA
jgi:CheY-like chemotaxis protein